MNVVLTATISPCANQPYLAVSDSETRLRQYREAVVFYLERQEVSGVIICDNSLSVNSDFHPEEALAKNTGKPLEILYLHTDESMISKYGKGYGEAEILDYVVMHSKLLAKDGTFLKATGRLKLLNVDTLIKQYHTSGADLIINQCGNGSVDSRFFIINTELYKKRFTGVKLSVNDRTGKYLENVYYDIITSHAIKTTCFCRFPRVNGQSGSLGYIYNDRALKRRIKLLWRDILSLFKYYKVK